MKMVSMKRSPEEKRKDETLMTAPSMDAPDYPWGLRLHLSEKELSKLGIEGANVGDVFTMAASVKVVSASMSEAEGSGKMASVELLVTDMGLSPPEAAGKTAADVLYAGSK